MNEIYNYLLGVAHIKYIGSVNSPCLLSELLKIKGEILRNNTSLNKSRD